MSVTVSMREALAAAKSHYAAGRAAQALRAIERAIRADDRDWRPWLQRGLVYAFLRRDHRRALDAYQAALARRRGDGLLLYNIGVCHDRLGDVPAAKKHYLRAIRAGYRSGNPYHNLAVLLLREGRADRAFAWWKRGAQIDPSHALVSYNLACGHAVRGRPRVALAWLAKAFAGGYADLARAETDVDLASVRALDEWRTLLARHFPRSRYAREKIVYRGVRMPRWRLADILDAQHVKTYAVAGKRRARIPFGRERDDWGTARGTCSDCFVFVGQLHQPGCDVEECPLCRNQALSCGHLDAELYD